MPEWWIYYGDGRIVIGHTQEDWEAAPREDVQVIVLWIAPEVSPWAYVTDRQLWTGEDEYDPFGWGVKLGKWAPDNVYWKLWEVAAYGPRNASS